MIIQRIFTRFIVLLEIGAFTSIASSFLTRIVHSFPIIPMTFRNAKSSEMIQPKGIIFDIDGTLANSWKLGFDATQKVLSNNNIPLITEELYHECTKYCTPDRLARHAGLVPEDGEEFQRIGEKLGKEFDDLYVGLVSPITAGFYEGITDLLISLSDENVRMGALTNACVAYAHAVLKTNCPIANSPVVHSPNVCGKGIYDAFMTIHGADTVEKPKPSPLGLLQCAKELGLSPSECVYVGDSPSDAVAAKSAGMEAIGVLWGSHSEESLRNAPFDTIISSVQDLKSILHPFINSDK
jgi:phosphoglycolate phosphatase-like HAD superfamily hydrolase